ncbi:MAG: site-specific integrase [Nitrospirales bacterium]
MQAIELETWIDKKGHICLSEEFQHVYGTRTNPGSRRPTPATDSNQDAIRQEKQTTMSDYDQEVEQIKTKNQPILDEFQAWLEKSRLAPKTVKSHLDNIDFFAHYLVYYDPVRSLDEADGGDVSTFLLDWYPRKAMWASKTNTRSYMASFRKFFKFMAESKRFDLETEDELRSILKENKEEFLDAVDDDGSDDYW